MLHAKALHGNPFDGHTLASVVAELEAPTGVKTRRIHVDKSLPLRRQGAIAATPTPRSSASGSAARCAASLPDPPRDVSPRRRQAGHWAYEGRTGWAAIILKAAAATASTPS